MPNKKSAAKRMRQNEKRRLRNRQAKSTLKTAIKKVDELVETGNVDAVKTELQHALSLIGKTAQKGIIHSRNASRKQSRLRKRVNTLLSAKENKQNSE